MKLLCKIIILTMLLSFSKTIAINSNHGLNGFEESKIDAVKNARLHSNMGNIYFYEKNYISALSEYKIAFNLTANTNSSSTYLYNIARCFMALGDWKGAKIALKGAIERDCMNITYYDALCDCYINLNEAQQEIKNNLKESENPYNRIVAGLLYLKTGRNTSAKILFDEFINLYPDMIITQDVKAILRNL